MFALRFYALQREREGSVNIGSLIGVGVRWSVDYKVYVVGLGEGGGFCLNS